VVASPDTAVERVEQVERFLPPDLTDDQAVGG
jgi:hypothetical protein